MSHEDVTRDLCRALAYCQGVVEILQNHYLAWCKSAVSQGNTELAVQNLDLVESCIRLLEKTITDTLEKEVEHDGKSDIGVRDAAEL